MALNKTSLITAALVAALPFLADILVFGATGRAERILQDPGVLIFNAGFAASPFILIGLVMLARKSVARALWIGFGLTVLLWGCYAASGWFYHLNEKGGGANIALFMLMMVWPFIVTILMGIIGRFEPDKVSQ
jgi:hypothetical protein